MIQDMTNSENCTMKVQCLLLKFISCCIARDPRMLNMKMFTSNAEIIQINKNSEFAGHVQIKLAWIPEAPDCSLVVKNIIVGRNFSQLFEVEPEHCVVKMGITCQNLTNHSNMPESGHWLLIGCVKQLDASRGQRSRFSGGL